MRYILQMLKKHASPLFMGILIGLFAFMMFSATQAAAKTLFEYHSVFEVLFIRSLLGLLMVFSGIILSKNNHLLKTKNPQLHLQRGLVGATGVICIVYAVKFLPLNIATIFFFSSGLIAPLLATILLKEKLSSKRLFWMFVGFIGVGVTVFAGKGGDLKTSSLYVIGVCFAIMGALIQSYISIFLRKIGSTENPITTSFYFFLTCALVTAIPTIIGHHPYQASLIPNYFILAITGVLTQIGIAYAYRFAPVMYVAPLSYTCLIWSILFDIFLWDVWPAPISLVGGCIVIGSCLCLLRSHSQ
jgi:drug/metabolite transporter (DMT)-like permease